MLVKELVNSCQNQWQGCHSFTVNTLFKIVFSFEDCENIDTYSIDDFNSFSQDGYVNKFIFYKINQRHEQKVISWYMGDKNTICILVDKF